LEKRLFLSGKRLSPVRSFVCLLSIRAKWSKSRAQISACDNSVRDFYRHLAVSRLNAARSRENGRRRDASPARGKINRRAQWKFPVCSVVRDRNGGFRCVRAILEFALGKPRIQSRDRSRETRFLARAITRSIVSDTGGELIGVAGRF